ncbi:hypothetical protein L2729_18200 [Shewanella gelidimarina]|uniref:hypothetical protein n=1 Tax=Shewanella gelidimarina TaxID=56813 RepID=UPI00201076C4|nr:hypothetical protein [Shewanella gelidimarina]MCL1059905.1 hypothetical protein [Shewanella gelidimarina]
MEAFNLLTTIIFVPLGILGLLLAMPFSLVKETEMESIRPHPYHLVVRKFWHPYRNLEIKSGALGYILLMGGVNDFGSPERDLIFDFLFIGSLLSYFIFCFWGYFFPDKKATKESLIFISILALFICCKKIGFIGAGFLYMYGGLIFLYWSFKLVTRKETDKFENA